MLHQFSSRTLPKPPLNCLEQPVTLSNSEKKYQNRLFSCQGVCASSTTVICLAEGLSNYTSGIRYKRQSLIDALPDWQSYSSGGLGGPGTGFCISGGGFFSRSSSSGLPLPSLKPPPGPPKPPPGPPTMSIIPTITIIPIFRVINLTC